MDIMDKLYEWYQRYIPTPSMKDVEGELRELPLSVPRKNYYHSVGTLMPILQGPIMRTPLSDIFCVTGAQESHSFCADMELMMLNCMEQYGYERGVRMCNGYILDLEECKYNRFEGLRNKLMALERERQIKAGERKVPYAPTPTFDTY